MHGYCYGRSVKDGMGVFVAWYTIPLLYLIVVVATACIV